MVETIGLHPCPDAAFVPIAPDEEVVSVVIAVPDFSKGDFTRVMYALWVFRIGEEHDNRQDLIATFRRPWPCDVKPVGVARVDGLDDLSSSFGMFRLDGFDDCSCGIEFQKLAAPFPRRGLANLANDGVVLLRKCREQKLAVVSRVCPVHTLARIPRFW